MTDEEQEQETEDGVSTEIQDALEATGNVEPESDESASQDAESESRVQGLLGKVGDLSGSGKSLDAYEEDPIASIWTDDETGETPRGAKHIARGVDGLSPLGSTHPFIDIGVGFVLLQAERKQKGLTGGSDDDSNDDIDSMGDMVT